MLVKKALLVIDRLALPPGVLGAGPGDRGSEGGLRYGFDTFGFGRLVCVPQRANQRSIRVAEKLGMAFERSFVHKGKEVFCYAKDNPNKQGTGEGA